MRRATTNSIRFQYIIQMYLYMVDSMQIFNTFIAKIHLMLICFVSGAQRGNIFAFYKYTEVNIA